MLLGGWVLLMAIVGYVSVPMLGAGAACCLVPMAGVLCLLAWCAAADVRDQKRDMRAGGR